MGRGSSLKKAMAKISESVIEEIKNRISIIEVISPYLTLTRKGDRYWGLCPFHEEKTPSFSVLPEKGFFHCFGCNKSGSIFDFVMEMEHLSFPEALKKLAEKLKTSKRIAVIIGAEGGFSDKESIIFNELSLKNLFNVSLGERILRTEAASIGAVAYISFLTGN